jgi:hypothetical protein
MDGIHDSDISRRMRPLASANRSVLIVFSSLHLFELKIPCNLSQYTGLYIVEQKKLCTGREILDAYLHFPNPDGS